MRNAILVSSRCDRRALSAVARGCAVVAVAATLVGLPVVPSAAQSSRGVGVLAGVVRDSSGARLVGAELTVEHSRVRGYSNDTGGFRLLGVEEGSGAVRVRRLGYTPTTFTFQVTAGQTTMQDVVLARVPVEIQPVVVSAQAPPTYSGWAAKFYERRDRGGMGRFITREDIERRRALRVTDLLRSIPGVTIRSSPWAANTVFLRNQRCPPFVWVDNAPAMSGYVDVDAFEPSTLEGIEIYHSASNIPAELSVPRDRMACGMLVLWTKMPDRPGRQVASSRYSASDLAALVSSLKVYMADQVDTRAELSSEETLRPVYPPAQRAEGVEGFVLAEFVVDTTGRVEMDTFGVVSPAAPAFVEAVRAALPAARFIPATRDGQRVRQLVQLPVRFAAGEAP